MKLAPNKRLTVKGRTVWDWLPIKDWNEHQVLQFLRERNIPLHPVYNYLRRFSCRVCIYMTKHDLRQVNKHDPDAIRIISDIEKEINFSMNPAGFLTDILKNDSVKELVQ